MSAAKVSHGVTETRREDSASVRPTVAPALRFKGFEGGWKWIRLGEKGSFIGGIGFPESEQGGESGLPFFKVSDMNIVGNEYTLVAANNYVSQEQVSRFGWHAVTSLPSIFFAKVGAAVMLNRKRLVKTPFLLDNNTMAYSLVGFDDENFAMGLFEKINLPSFVQIGALPSLSSQILGSYQIPMPEFPEEQRRIGDLYRGVVTSITERQSALEKLQALKKSMLVNMFPQGDAKVPKIRFKGFEGEWEGVRLGDEGHTYNGLSGKTSADFGHGAGKYVTYMNVFVNPISKEGQCESVEIDKRQNEVRPGDVFFTTSSETPDEVGMSSVWLSSGKNTYLNSFCFGYRPHREIDSKFLAYLLRSMSFREKVVKLAQGISRFNISKGKVMDIHILMPEKEEQVKIGEYFYSLDRLIAARRDEIEQLKHMKAALLNRMFV